MLVKIKFLGVLSSKFGSEKIVADIDPNYDALHGKIADLHGGGTHHYVVLKQGVPVNMDADVIVDGDEFCVFLPISGG